MLITNPHEISRTFYSKTFPDKNEENKVECHSADICSLTITPHQSDGAFLTVVRL